VHALLRKKFLVLVHEEGRHKLVALPGKISCSQQKESNGKCEPSAVQGANPFPAIKFFTEGRFASIIDKKGLNSKKSVSL